MLGPNDNNMMAMPVVIPKLVAKGAEQSWRRRTITWQGTAIRRSRTLPFSSHEIIRVTHSDEFRK